VSAWFHEVITQVARAITWVARLLERLLPHGLRAALQRRVQRVEGGHHPVDVAELEVQTRGVLEGGVPHLVP